MKTVIIDNKHYIEGKIVMLPTKDLSPIIINKDDRLVLSLTDNCSPGFHKYIGNRFQHLYLVCDLPIEEGIDWVCYRNEEVFKARPDDSTRNYVKKVIATTDNSLNIYKGDFIVYNQKFLQFPQSFIKEFVKRQGKDVDVLVEVMDNTDYDGFSEQEVPYIIPNWQIKLNPDNTVNLIFK